MITRKQIERYLSLLREIDMLGDQICGAERGVVFSIVRKKRW